MSLSRAELQAMDRDELIEAVVELSDRVEDLEKQPVLDPMENAAFRRILANASGLDIDDEESTSIERADALIDRLVETFEATQELQDRMDRLESDVAQSKTSTTSSQTKVGLAMDVAMDEAVRRCSKGIRGGSVDYPAVRDIADREHGTELNSGTVYDAFDRLADEWAAFHVKDGQDGPNTDNKQLRCDKESISTALEEAVSSGGN